MKQAVFYSCKPRGNTDVSFNTLSYQLNQTFVLLFKYMCIFSYSIKFLGEIVDLGPHKARCLNTLVFAAHIRRQGLCLPHVSGWWPQLN